MPKLVSGWSRVREQENVTVSAADSRVCEEAGRGFGPSPARGGRSSICRLRRVGGRVRAEIEVLEAKIGGLLDAYAGVVEKEQERALA